MKTVTKSNSLHRKANMKMLKTDHNQPLIGLLSRHLIKQS